jgi:hypothetical protein
VRRKIHLLHVGPFIIVRRYTYGVGELARWCRLAALGGVCVLFSATLVDFASQMIR